MRASASARPGLDCARIVMFSLTCVNHKALRVIVMQTRITARNPYLMAVVPLTGPPALPAFTSCGTSTALFPMSCTLQHGAPHWVSKVSWQTSRICPLGVPKALQCLRRGELSRAAPIHFHAFKHGRALYQGRTGSEERFFFLFFNLFFRRKDHTHTKRKSRNKMWRPKKVDLWQKTAERFSDVRISDKVISSSHC